LDQNYRKEKLSKVSFTQYVEKNNYKKDYCKNTEVDGTSDIILHVFLSQQKAQNISSSSNHIKRDKRNESVCNCNIF